MKLQELNKKEKTILKNIIKKIRNKTLIGGKQKKMKTCPTCKNKYDPQESNADENQIYCSEDCEEKYQEEQ